MNNDYYYFCHQQKDRERILLRAHCVIIFPSRLSHRVARRRDPEDQGCPRGIKNRKPAEG